MRILHTNHLRGWGGQSNRILTEAVGALRQGHQVALAVPEPSELAKRAAAEGIEILPNYRIKPPLFLWWSIPDILRFRRDVLRWKPDVIHLHGSQDTWTAMLALSLPGNKRPPVIRCKHNMFSWKRHRTNRWLYSRIDAFISISTFIDRQIEYFPKIGRKPRARIYSVPDLEALGKEWLSMRHEVPEIKPGMFVWGSTGRMRSEKGFDILLKAFAVVHKAKPETFLLLAGDGSLRGEMEQLARDLSLLPNAVKFLGFRTDVPAILRSVDAYVLASRSEGLGTAILEALAVELPVVATDVGGIPDSVRHEQTGLLVPSENPAALAEAMLRLMEDAALRERLAQNAGRMVREEFVEKELVRRTLDFYVEVINSCRDRE